MKKFVFLFLFIFVFASNVANAMYVTLNPKSVATNIQTQITLIDSKVQDMAKWKSIQTTLAALGDIKEGIKKLKKLKEEIDEYITLFRKGLDLIDESLYVANSAIRNIEEAKKLIAEPKKLIEQAQRLADDSVELIKKSKEYGQDYEDTIKQAEVLMKNTDSVSIQAAKQLHDKAEELNQTSIRYYNEAQALSRQADMLLDDTADLYDKAERLSRQAVRDTQRACMLKIKGMQYKAELKRKFCKNPTPGVVSNPETYCEEQQEEANNKAGENADVCSQKAQDLYDMIEGTDK